VISVLVALLTLAPGDAVRLAPPEQAVPPAGMVRSDELPAPVRPSTPSRAPVAVLGGVSGLAIWAASRRGREQSAGPVKGASEEPLVVFVSGHGNPSPPGLFAGLIAGMGLDPSRVRYFDYRWADGGSDLASASQDASIDAAADSLNSYLAGLAESGQAIYLIGFSKGGAGIAELVGRWDRGDPGPNSAVVGAALLDPPLASGIHGFLQSVGTRWGPIPDDGGYDPIVCSGLTCVDSRRYLGDVSGVEVMVVRNPKAGITNFADAPEGLRVYEASDGGPGFLRTLFTRPWNVAHRAAEAHMAVLQDSRVADCIAAEMEEVGSCDLPRAGYRPPAGLIVHGPGSAVNMPVNRVL
jgi:hypothetical protein